jgi:hypothetical protein
VFIIGQLQIAVFGLFLSILHFDIEQRAYGILLCPYTASLDVVFPVFGTNLLIEEE